MSRASDATGGTAAGKVAGRHRKRGWSTWNHSASPSESLMLTQCRWQMPIAACRAVRASATSLGEPGSWMRCSYHERRQSGVREVN